MHDPISGRIDIAFFSLALIATLLIVVDPRRVLEFLFSRRGQVSNGVIVSLRILAALCAAGSASLLLIHLVRSHH
jgi:hypothetical protein